MNKPSLHWGVSLAVGVAGGFQSLEAAIARPNVIIIVTDDQGYGDLSVHGNKYLETPRIDQLVRESAELEYFYAAPCCAPTRASLLTGRTHIDTGVWGVHWARDYLNLDETTLADRLKAGGYDTAMVGKWHSGRAPAWMPWNRGFNEAWVSSLYHHENCEISHNGKFEQTKGWADEQLTDIAINWIGKDHSGQPFFLLMAYMEPHAPWAAPDDLIQKYKKKGCSDLLSLLNGMIDHLDGQVGRLLDALDQKGLRDNTLLVFMSDNGPIGNNDNGEKLSEKDNAMRNPQNLRGVKGNIWENGIRVPCFVRWPARIPACKTPALADVIDIFPTVLDAAGIPLPTGGLPIYGRSLLPLLTSAKPDWPEPREYFKPYWRPFWDESWSNDGILENLADVQYDNQINAYRSGPYKLVKNRRKGLELYNVINDPSEQVNLAASHPEQVQAMNRQMTEAFNKMLQSGRCYGQPRFHIGNPEYDAYDQVGEILSGSQIPCCSAVHVTGNVVVNDHYSAGWNSAGDSQTILVNVVTPRVYKVELTANRITPGAKVRLEIGNAVLEAVINNPGQKAELGTVSLDQGPQELTLRLVALPVGAKSAFDKLSLIEFH